MILKRDAKQKKREKKTPPYRCSLGNESQSDWTCICFETDNEKPYVYIFRTARV